MQVIPHPAPSTQHSASTPLTTERSASLSVEEIVERIFETRRIARADQQVFMSVLLSKDCLTPTERQQIDRVFDALRQGRIRVVD